MLADEQHGSARESERLRREQSEFPIADDCDARLLRHIRPLSDSPRGGQRLCKDCALVRYFVGHSQKIADGQLQKLRVCAVAPRYAKHCAIRTVTRIAHRAQSAMPATRIDFANHATPHECFIRRALNEADELMPNRALKTRVAAHDPHIRLTNSTERHAHNGLARALRLRQDRKSTRLNSSHANISYAVFCLKKKKK